jgi:hypothetical protein
LAFNNCAKQDIDELWARQAQQKARLDSLDAWALTVNNNITSLQVLIDALQRHRFINRVTPFDEPAPGGYYIYFDDDLEPNPMIIYHGTGGTNGTSPKIAVKQDPDDGVYYWTLDGDWLKDDEGNKIRVTGNDGNNGATPKIDIYNGNWYICPSGACTGTPATDGEGWEDTGVKAEGTDGNPGATPKIAIGEGYWYVCPSGACPDWSAGNWLADGWEATGVKAEGIDGNPGATPKVGIYNGYWYICPSGACTDAPPAEGWNNTGVKAEGTDGNPGATPKIDIYNGYWYICPSGACTGTPATDGDGGWEDTGVPATGNPGDPGAPGATPKTDIYNGYWYVCPSGTCTGTPPGEGWNNTGVPATGNPGNPGAPGNDGATPTVIIGSDNHWYICPSGTCTGTPANDGDGGWKDTGVPATGNPGNDGEPGDSGDPGNDGATPTVAIGDDGNWYVCPAGTCSTTTISVDEGWQDTEMSAIGEPGEDGDAFFARVDYSNDDYVEFILADGDDATDPAHANNPKFTVPKYRSLSIAFTQPSSFDLGDTKNISYTTTGPVQNIRAVDVPRGWTVTPVPASSVITVIAPPNDGKRYTAAGTVTLLVSDGTHRTITEPLALACPPYVPPAELGIAFAQPEAFKTNGDKTVDFTLTGNATAVNVLEVPAGWTVTTTVNPAGDAGNFYIKAPASFDVNAGCKAFVFVSDVAGKTVVRALELKRFANATSGAFDQTVRLIYDEITPTTFSAPDGGTISGLPNGLTGSWSNGVYTISGKPYARVGDYPYTYTSECVVAAGTITLTCEDCDYWPVPETGIKFISTHGDMHSWQNAKERCENFHGGSNDWRMPNMDELHAMCPEAIMKTAPFRYEEYYWSSTLIYDHADDFEKRYGQVYLDSVDPEYSCGNNVDRATYAYGSVCIKD